MDLRRICYGCFQEKPEASPVCPHCGFNEEEEQPFLALPMATVLQGRYLMGRVLGVGGFGITYLGYDQVLEIKVAVKEYMPSGLAVRHADRYRVMLTGRRKEDYENGLDRFLEEARILAKLQGTPNIVSVQDYFRENNTAYFVMEYVDGMSLKDYLASQGGKIPFDQALTILLPIMQALTRVHGLGLTHRDISPDNVSITSGGESKLLDFGAARFSSSGEESVSVILKHGFAPEEQYSSHGSQGPWTDVYAMGATLYRCVTGELPPDSIARVHHDTLKKPSALGIPLPANIEGAMMKALAVKAEDRFPSMEAFLQAFGAGTAPPKAARRAGRPPAERGGARAKLPPKSFALKAAALVVCAAVIGLGVWKLAAGNSAPPEAHAGPTVSSSEPQNSLPEPSGSVPVDLTEYSNDSLNFSMKVPAAFTQTDPERAVFTSSDGSCSLQIGFYTYWAGFPVYSLADAASNAEKYVQYFIGLLTSTDITEHKILSEGYRQIGALNSYQIQFEAVESGGSAMEFLAAFIQGQNGFGCYNMIASYPQGDEVTREAILTSAASFQCLGPAETSYQLLSDEKLSFQFMYAEEEAAPSFEIGDNVLTATSMAGSEYSILTISAIPSSGKKTADQVLAQVTDGLDAIYPGITQHGEQQTQESGGMEWVVRNYASESQGITVYMSYSAAVWQDQAYLILLTSSQEAQLEGSGLKRDIMGSLRPAA